MSGKKKIEILKQVIISDGKNHKSVLKPVKFKEVNEAVVNLKKEKVKRFELIDNINGFKILFTRSLFGNSYEEKRVIL